jgi:hypothetical protein
LKLRLKGGAKAGQVEVQEGPVLIGWAVSQGSTPSNHFGLDAELAAIPGVRLYNLHAANDEVVQVEVDPVDKIRILHIDDTVTV